MEWSQDWGSENQVYHLASRLMRGILKKPSFPLECKLQRAEVMLVAFTALSPACRKGEDQFKCWTVTCCMNYTSLVYSFHVCKTLILRTFTFQIIWEPFEYKSERFRARIAYPAVTWAFIQLYSECMKTLCWIFLNMSKTRYRSMIAIF